MGNCINSNEETRRAIRALYENAVKSESQLAKLKDENSSVRRTFARLILLIFINARKFSFRLFRFILPPRKVAVTGEHVQTRHNSRPAVVSYIPSLGDKRKILHCIPTLVTGGSQQLVVDLLENISEHDHQVVTARTPGPIGYDGVPNHLLPVSKHTSASCLSDFFSTIKPDLLHVHFWATIENVRDWRWYEWVFKQGLACNIPIVQNCNNPTFPYFDERIRRNVYVSHYARSVFGINAPGNAVIYPGSNFQRFKRSTAYRPNDTIGMVYRLERDKLNELSIEPFIQAVKMRPQTRVLIVGGGILYDLFTARVAEEGMESNFEFTGYVGYDELPQYYERLGLFVAPVYQESFGQVTPFAMNMGIPVVGYDVGALPEILDDLSVLAPSENVISLSQIIVDLLDDKEKMRAISRKNNERAQSLFSLETMVASYRSLYAEVLAE